VTGATATSLSSIFEISAEPERESLVVSLHDVAPATRVRVEIILGELAHRGVPVSSLLVVPNYHHCGCFTEDRAFVRWLQELEAKGHEIVIHGYFHQRPARNGENLQEKFFTRLYTKGEGEFYDLDYDEAFRRITRAREEFTGAGLTPRGFIAPAWLLGAAAERAAADAEMEYTTRLAGVRDLRSGADFRARTLTYSVRSGWRRTASLAWNTALARHLAGASLARLSIHPPDRDHPEIWRQLLRLTDGLIENRTATTYRDWIADRRARRRT
jgi:predicted deacetylase